MTSTMFLSLFPTVHMISYLFMPYSFIMFSYFVNKITLKSLFFRELVILYKHVKVTFSALGNSLKPGGMVQTFVVNAFCKYLFEKKNPRESYKHYFFTKVGDYLLDNYATQGKKKDLRDNAIKCFNGASTARRLYSSNLLYFPIYFHGHWFVIMVQLKEKKFVILDSCINVFGEHSTYHKNVMKLFKPNFIKLWQETVKRDMGFPGFITSFADVPQHDVEYDSGVFIMKFLELWEPSVKVKEKFGQSDIPNIRKKYVHDMIFCKANEEVDGVDILKNYDQQVFAKYFQDQDM